MYFHYIVNILCFGKPAYCFRHSPNHEIPREHLKHFSINYVHYRLSSKKRLPEASYRVLIYISDLEKLFKVKRKHLKYLKIADGG